MSQAWTRVPGEGLPPQERLRRARDFSEVLKKGRRAEHKLLTVVLLKQRQPSAARLGLAVSRRVGGAAQRNHAKRLVREAFRRQKPRGVEIVVIPKAAIVEASLRDVQRELAQLLARLLRRGSARDVRPDPAD